MLNKIFHFFFSTKKLDFIIIGAQKSGTTSLHNYLDKHPDIFMSKPFKEPRYFMPFSFVKNYYKEHRKSIFIENKKDLLKNYMLQGYNNEKLFGESSTDYTLADRAKEHNIPHKIYKYNKSIKLIYILRNPYERLYSNYRHDQKMGRHIGLSFGEYLKKEESNLVFTSLYYYQISQYLKYFPKENILILPFDDFIHQTPAILKGIFQFLNVNDEKYNYKVEYEKFNKGTDSESLDYQKAFEDNLEIYRKIEKDFLLLQNNIGIRVVRK